MVIRLGLHKEDSTKHSLTELFSNSWTELNYFTEKLVIFLVCQILPEYNS